MLISCSDSLDSSKNEIEVKYEQYFYILLKSLKKRRFLTKTAAFKWSE